MPKPNAAKERRNGSGTTNGLCFHCDTLPPSLNTMLRQHWSARSREREYFNQLFRYYLYGKAAPEPCEIIVTWRVMRLMDEDNAKARFKLLGDALVKAGILSDDNPDVIKSLVVKQERVKHRAEQGFDLEVREYLPFAELETEGDDGQKDLAKER